MVRLRIPAAPGFPPLGTSREHIPLSRCFLSCRTHRGALALSHRRQRAHAKGRERGARSEEREWQSRQERPNNVERLLAGLQQRDAAQTLPHRLGEGRCGKGEAAGQAARRVLPLPAGRLQPRCHRHRPRGVGREGLRPDACSSTRSGAGLPRCRPAAAYLWPHASEQHGSLSFRRCLPHRRAGALHSWLYACLQDSHPPERQHLRLPDCPGRQRAWFRYLFRQIRAAR